MKYVLVILFFVGNVCFADDLAERYDLALSHSVMRMGTCTGTGTVLGFEFQFRNQLSGKYDKEGRQEGWMVLMTIPPYSSVARFIVTDDDSSYSLNTNDDFGRDIYRGAQSPWKVKDQKILLWVQSRWVPMNIDLKKKTCSVKLYIPPTRPQ